MPAWASFRWPLQRHLLTKMKSADNKNLFIESADKKKLFIESADKKKICWQQKSSDRISWQETSSYKISLRKERHLAMEKILKYLLRGKMINATMNMSLKSITDALDVNVYGRWKICSHLFKNVIQQLVATFHRSEHETFLWQKLKLLTIEICWQNLLTKCESAN